MVPIKKRVLVVDDQSIVHENCKLALTDAGYAVRTDARRRDAIERLKGLALLAVAPFIGLAYVVLMPLIGFAVFFAVLGTGLAEMLPWARS